MADEYYFDPNCFRNKKKYPIRYEDRICDQCKKTFEAKWKMGRGPQTCSLKCLKLKNYEYHMKWAKAHPERMKILTQRILARRRKKQATFL